MRLKNGDLRPGRGVDEDYVTRRVRRSLSGNFTYYVDMSRHMDEIGAIEALAALAQPTRLDVFRFAVRAFPDSLPAGEFARRCDVPHNTMSTHLAILTRAGLLAVERQGRAMQYRFRLEGFRALMKFLTGDCCGGRAEICAPLLADLVPCCPPQRRSTRVRAPV